MRRQTAISVLAASMLVASANEASAWQFRMGSPREDVVTQLSSLATDPAGGLVLSGHVDVISGDQSEHQFVIKLGSDGADLWQHRLDTQGSTSAVRIDDESNVFISGSVYPGGDRRPYLMKLDGSTGGLLWGSPVVAAPSESAAEGIGNAGLALSSGSILSAWGSANEPFASRGIARLSGETGAEIWKVSLPVAPEQVLTAGSDALVTVASFQQEFLLLGFNLRKLSFATGEEVWSRTVADNFFPTSAIDSSGNIVAASHTYGSQATSPTVVVEKFASATGETQWRRELSVPILVGFDKALLLDDSDNAVVAFAQVDVQGDVPYTRVLKLSAADGATLSELVIPDRHVRTLEKGPLGELLLGGEAGTLAESLLWVATVDKSLGNVLWERIFERGRMVGVVASSEGSVRFGAYLFSPAAVLVGDVSSIDGSDTPQACGNGIIDDGEECDDGDDDPYDECPSASSHQCRYTNSLDLARSSLGKPARDRKSCQFQWYVVNPLNERDRYGAMKSLHTCEDGDPWCDFDSVPGSCRFRLVACLNNQDISLPACTPRGVSSVSFLKPRFRPRLASKEAEAQEAAELIAMLSDAPQHLLDPSNPSAGYDNAPPLAPEDQNHCTAPLTIDIPVAGTAERPRGQMITLNVRSQDAAERATRNRAKLRLLCEPAD